MARASEDDRHWDVFAFPRAARNMLSVMQTWGACGHEVCAVLAAVHLPIKSSQIAQVVLGAQSLYVRMRDGVHLACDVLLPTQPSPSGRYPVVFFQTR